MLGAFGVIALRLRRSVIGTLDEAADNIISKFVLSNNNSLSSKTSITGGNTSNNSIMRNVQSAASTVGTTAMAGNQLSDLTGKLSGGAGGELSGNMSGDMNGMLSGGFGGVDSHSSIASGTGDSDAMGNTDMNVTENNGGAEITSMKTAQASGGLIQNANSASSEQNSADNGITNSDQNSQNASNVVSDIQRTGLMRGGAMSVSEANLQNAGKKDVSAREAGKNAMQFDSLAEATGQNKTQMFGAASHASKNVSALSSSHDTAVAGDNHYAADLDSQRNEQVMAAKEAAQRNAEVATGSGSKSGDVRNVHANTQATDTHAGSDVRNVQASHQQGGAQSVNETMNAQSNAQLNGQMNVQNANREGSMYANRSSEDSVKNVHASNVGGTQVSSDVRNRGGDTSMGGFSEQNAYGGASMHSDNKYAGMYRNERAVQAMPADGTVGRDGRAGANGGAGIGSTGATGVNGVNGLGRDGANARAVRGLQGMNGVGHDGFVGSTGNAGMDGANGTRGVAGFGTVGGAGANGVNGFGRDGAVGAAGAYRNGSNGTDGAAGRSVAGMNGVDGRSVAGTNGMNGLSTNGANGGRGVAGANGLNGIAGRSVAGVNGMNGASGVVVNRSMTSMPPRGARPSVGGSMPAHSVPPAPRNVATPSQVTDGGAASHGGQFRGPAVAPDEGVYRNQNE